MSAEQKPKIEGEKLKETTSPFEVCRLSYGRDPKHEENHWWEARLVTGQDDKVLQRVDYIDYQGVGFLRALLEPLQGPANLNKSIELRHTAHAKLVSLLVEDSWETLATDKFGFITMMKREKLVSIDLESGSK